MDPILLAYSVSYRLLSFPIATAIKPPNACASQEESSSCFLMEFWTLKRDYWALPIGVEWPDGTDMARIEIGAGVSLMTIQFRAVEAFLKECGAYRHDGYWWLSERVLKSVAVPTPTSDPEELVEWRPSPKKFSVNPRAKDAEHRSNRREFIHEYCKVGLIPDPVRAEAVFVSMCHHMLHWLLVRQKPVDLLFCRLIPVPFRPNWKQVLLQTELSSGGRPLTDILAKDQTDARLIKRGILDFLLRPEMLMYNAQDKHIYWTIDVHHAEAWWRTVKTVEKAKLSKSHRGGYFGRCVPDAIKRQIRNLLRLYGAHLREIARPYVLYATARQHRRKVWLSGKAHRQGTAKKADTPSLTPFTSDVRDGEERAGVPVEVAAEKEGVPALRSLQLNTEDVRDSRY